LEELRTIREELAQAPKKLQIFVTLYTNQLNLPIGPYLNLIDVVTLWTWNSAEIPHLEANIKKLESIAPKNKKMLGCYFIDYEKKASVPVALMARQCELGLEWLRKGRLDGMVFLGNTVEDLGLESVDWTRNWIRKVGDTMT
jgi:hypothetical protein